MLGTEIKRHREERALNQETLAELVGVSRQAVSKWEQGQALPTADNLDRLERALELEPGALSKLPLQVEDLPAAENRLPKGLFWWVMGIAALLLLTFSVGLVLGNAWPHRPVDTGNGPPVTPGPLAGEEDWQARAAAFPGWPDHLELTKEKQVDLDFQGLPYGEAEACLDREWEVTGDPITYAGLTLALARTEEEHAGPTLWVLGRAGEGEPWQVLDWMAEASHIPYQDFYEGPQWARPAGNVLGYDCIRVDADGGTALFTLKEGNPRCVFRFFGLAGLADLDLDLDGKQEAVCREDGAYLIYDREVTDFFRYILPELPEDQLPLHTWFRFDEAKRAFGFQCA